MDLSTIIHFLLLCRLIVRLLVSFSNALAFRFFSDLNLQFVICWPGQNTAQTESNKTTIIPLISDDEESDDAFASVCDDAFANNDDGNE